VIGDYLHRDWTAPDGLSPDRYCEIIFTNILQGQTVGADRFYKEQLRRVLRGRAVFFTQKKSYVGLCSYSVQIGDKVFVALGKQTPLILRETPGQPTCYRVVGGECYVHGMMNQEAFLGRLPNHWNFIWAKDLDLRALYVMSGYLPHQEDPRLPHLPSTWKAVYKDPKSEIGWCDEEYDSQGNIRQRLFLNVETNETQHSDPRLLPDFLQSIGVEFDDINLV
jgi:hypothetical protein